MSDVELITQKLGKLGFEDVKLKELNKNNKLLVIIDKLIALIQKDDELSKIVRNSIYNLAVLFNKDKEQSLPLELIANKEDLIAYILKHYFLTENLNNSNAVTLEEVYKFITNNANGNATLNDGEFPKKLEKLAGINLKLTDEDINNKIKTFLNETIKDELSEKRYTLAPKVYAEVRKLDDLKFCNFGDLKKLIDAEILAILGPKDERDAPKPKVKQPKAKKTENNKKEFKAEPVRNMFNEGFLGDLHKVGENPQLYPETLKKHLDFTKGKVHTRFPPEPNGFLHIGHSKAIMVNFGFAAFNDGHCYLRYDDTNPEAEEQKYFDSILNMIHWLGYKPWKITYSSDYFDQLYAFAIKLIEFNKGYVCKCSNETIKKNRGIDPVTGQPGGERNACEHRELPIEWHLAEFTKMHDGVYKPGEAILRMKQDLKNPSPQMWDLIAYRVLDATHPRTGDKWKIYPTYDFTHCIVDSLENITHSLCTTEFYLSRESYEWLLDQLHIFRTAQREYGRLNITGTIMSKRRIAKLVNSKVVRDWNDPRLFTLESLKRRGIPPGAILSFINTLGVTTSTTNIQVSRFETSIRKFLEETVPRLMLVLDPIEVVIDNLDESFDMDCELPYKQGNDEFGKRSVKFGNKIYIERSDFSENSLDKEFFRLTPEQPVGLLKVPKVIKFKSLEKDANGKITKIHVEYDTESTIKKPKTYIHWVSSKSATPIKEVRLYNQLFNSENPASLSSEEFLTDINPESEIILKGALIENNFKEVAAKSPIITDSLKKLDFYVQETTEASGKERIRFQGMRMGYFCVDYDSSDEEIILNRIVELKN
ncbi:hypothetical protein QEN19_000313 [Hanseniaspora menglaensis]